MPVELLSGSESQTADIAAHVARLLRPGNVVFLKGELGAGKTFFIRAAARELGVTEPVTSPSFAMGQTYSGPVTVHHLDLYRLSSFGTEDFADFEPFFEDDAITFIEWPEQAEPFLSGVTLVISLEHVDEHSRRISLESAEPRLSGELEAALAGTGD